MGVQFAVSLSVDTDRLVAAGRRVLDGRVGSVQVPRGANPVGVVVHTAAPQLRTQRTPHSINGVPI